MKLSFRFAALVIIFMSSVQSFGGAEGKGGADAVNGCVSETLAWPELYNLAELVVGPGTRKIAGRPVGMIYDDLFEQLATPLGGGMAPPLVPENQLETFEDGIVSLVLKFIEDKDSEYPHEASQLRDAINSLKFNRGEIKKVKTGFNLGLKGLTTDGGCSHEQWAWQNLVTHDVNYQTFSNGQTWYNSDGFVGPFSLAILKVHEGYIKIRTDQGENITAAETFARGRVSRIVDSSEFGNRLMTTYFSLGSTSQARATDILDEYADYNFGGRHASRGKHASADIIMKYITDLITQLQFPCAMNSGVTDKVVNFVPSYKAWGINYPAGWKIQTWYLCQP
jgi:hypothetical protein